jgi:hypothetical protein
MFKPKTTISGRLENSSWEWILHLDGVRTNKKRHPFEYLFLSSGEWLRIEQFDTANGLKTKRPGEPGLS